MTRRLAWGRVAMVALLAVCLFPLAAAYAADLGSNETQMEVSGLNVVFATIWGYLQGTAGKVVAALMIGRGLGKMGSGNERDKPYTNMAAGAGVAVVPPIVTSVFESAPAAVGTLAPVGTVFERFVAGFAGLHAPQDPIVLFLVVTTLLTLAVLSSRRRANALPAR